MKYLFSLILSILFSINSWCNSKSPVSKELFDYNWKFSLGDTSGAENPEFDDSEWRTLNLPHDFSIEQPFDSANITGPEGGYTYSGIAWYRKHFNLEINNAERVIIQFNGVYRNSIVWINGHKLGFWPYGYTSFYYDLTSYLFKSGKENVIAVKVDNSKQPNSRWYTGAGIYRHVWLYRTGNVYFNHWGIFVQTLKAENNEAKILTNSEICNENNQPKKITVISKLFDNHGNNIVQNQKEIIIPADSMISVRQELTIKDPELWSIDNPYLYSVECTVLLNSTTQDRYMVNYGIRTAVFNPDNGFILNGKHIKLKGTNNHHDCGPLGSACADYSFERQLRILKQMGCNALRISHNPPAPELLECADSMGFVVINEIFDEWTYGKRNAGYSSYFNNWYEKDITNWIRRDRNHPSVVAWSLGNEVGEQRSSKGREIAVLLKNTAQKSDTTRPFTAGCNEIPSANKFGMAQQFDIVGYNYREPLYEKDHRSYPERVIFGSETVNYPYQPGNQFPLHTYKEWVKAQQSDFVAGEFLWTGFDYLGETGIGLGGTDIEPWNYWPKWPYRSAICGVIDICGFEKPGYWFRKALWSNDPVIYIATGIAPDAFDKTKVPFWGWANVFSHWNHNTEGDTLPVHVYTNCKNVELFINDLSFGKKVFNIENEAFLTWNVPYLKGKIEAVGLSENHEEIRHVIYTSDVPAKINLTCERSVIKADEQDITYIKATLVDKNEMTVYFSDQVISFEITGNGILKAVGNGNAKSITSFNGEKIETYNGQCLVIVQSTGIPGKIFIKAGSKGLKSAEIEINSTGK